MNIPYLALRHQSVRGDVAGLSITDIQLKLAMPELLASLAESITSVRTCLPTGMDTFGTLIVVHVLPAAGVCNFDGAGLVDAVDIDVKCSTVVAAGDANAERVGGG